MYYYIVGCKNSQKKKKNITQYYNCYERSFIIKNCLVQGYQNMILYKETFEFRAIGMERRSLTENNFVCDNGHTSFIILLFAFLHYSSDKDSDLVI